MLDRWKSWVGVALVLGASTAQAQDLDGGVPPVVVPTPDAPDAQVALTPADMLDAAAPLLVAEPLPLPILTPVEPDQYGANARIQRPAGPGEFELGGTGSKVNAPLREVPYTVNVIDQQQLRERGVIDQQQALELLPGVVPMFTYGGFQQNQMRGFAALNLYDGRRDMRSVIAESAPVVGLFDVERIEVLRGPSAVLYGYGAVGGVINQIRRRASRTPLYELEGGLGTPHAWLAHAAAQGPVLSKLAYRVDIGHVTRRDFRGGQTDRNQVTSTFQYKPTSRDTFNLRFSVAVDRYNTDVGIPTVLNANDRLELPYGVRYQNRYSSRQDHFDYSRMEAALDYRHDFSQAVYAEVRAWVVRDHYSYLAAESLSYVPATADMRSQVAREYLYFARGWRPLQASADLHWDLQTGPIKHQLVGGYQLESFTGVSDRSNLDGDAAELQNVDFAYPVDQSGPVSYNLTAQDHYRIATHSLYAYDHVKLLDSLLLTGGVRLDFIKSRTRRDYLDRDGQSIPDPTTMAFRRPNLKDDFNTTGSVGLVYTPFELLTTYVSYANSYMPQFVSPSARAVTDYNAERSQQFEGGVRVRVDQNQQQLELDAAGYLIRKSNLLVPKGPQAPDDFQTAGLAQSRGLDLSLRYAVPYVQLMGAYSLIDSEYRKFVGSDPISGDNVSFAGKELILAPRHSGNAWGRVSFGKYVSAGVGTRVRGRTWADTANRLALPSYALLDASLTVGNERASFTLRANNLLNRIDYFSSVINMSQVTPGPGREILGTLRLAL